MFDIKDIKLKDFKSYSGVHYFEFPDEPGLYYLTGINKFNKRLGANATGKTSFIDAIQWCLYGRTTRGLRAGDVITFGKKKCYVEITLMLDNEKFKIKRTQNPNSISLNSENTSQEVLNDLIRINQEAFNYSVILPQFGNSFFDLLPTSKLNLFSQIMNLDFWLEKSDNALEATLYIEDTIKRLETKISNDNIKIEHLDYEVTSLKTKEKVFDEEKTIRIKKLNSKKINIKKDIKLLNSEIKKLSKRLKDYKNKGSNNKLKSDSLFKTVNSLENNIKELKFESNNRATSINNISNEIKSIKKLKQKDCPVCKQKVTIKHVKEHIRLLNKELTQNEQILKKNNVFISELETKLELKKRRYKKYSKEISKLDNKITNLKTKVNNKNYKKEVNLNQVDETNKEINEEKTRINPFQNMIKERINKLEKTQTGLEKKKEKLITLETKLESVKFWVKGFKRVRLFVIEQALKLLELEINNNFTDLGLVDWEVVFDVERETKTGNVSRGFSVFIKNSKIKKPTRWEAWSGGETQRLRLAGDLGLSNLIMENNGLKGDVEFHDEPSKHLSPEGVEDMLETLHQRAFSLNKKIWLVDHQTINFGNFSGILTVDMSKEGKSTLHYNH